MGFKLRDKDKGFKSFQAGLKATGQKTVKVGIQGNEATQVHRAAERDGGAVTGSITMVELGSVHEFGATITNGYGRGIRIVIPQRSFLRSTADQNRRKYDARLEAIIKRLADHPQRYDAEGELLKLGELVRRDIMDRMRRGEIEPPIGRQQAEARGELGPPLVDTGMLMNSIRAVVK